MVPVMFHSGQLNSSNRCRRNSQKQVWDINGKLFYLLGARWLTVCQWSVHDCRDSPCIKACVFMFPSGALCDGQMKAFCVTDCTINCLVAVPDCNVRLKQLMQNVSDDTIWTCICQHAIDMAPFSFSGKSKCTDILSLQR